jgi:hypothetical protein
MELRAISSVGYQPKADPPRAGSVALVDIDFGNLLF